MKTSPAPVASGSPEGPSAPAHWTTVVTGAEAERRAQRLKLVTQVLVWVFALAWAFDFKANVQGTAQGGSLAQVIFLGLSVGSGSLAMLLNARLLLQRPGVWLLLLWWGFLAYVTVDSLAQGVTVGHFIRVAVPYFMIGFGMAVAHVAGARGLTPSQIVIPMVIAGMINIGWRIFYGFAFKEATLETARMEVFSPAMNPLFAYLGVAVFLRPKFHWSGIVVALVAFTGVFITVTRALIFPIAMSMFLGVVCFTLGVFWRVFSLRHVPRKLVVLAGSAAFGVLVVAGVYVVSPLLIERWTNRLFHQGEGRTSKDLSWLTREAEAKAMFDILDKEPLHYIMGKGMGAPYYWDASYWPELYVIYPSDTDFSDDIWWNGHSVWTYTIFATGIIGLLFHLGLFGGAMVHGVRAVRWQAQRGLVDGQTWLGFLPVFVVMCLLSESATSNQLVERLPGVMLGLAAGLPQALYFSRQRSGQLPQEILRITFPFQRPPTSRAIAGSPHPHAP